MKKRKNGTSWQVLAMPNDLSDRKEIGVYSTKFQALEVIREKIKQYSKYGTALVKKEQLGGFGDVMVDAWNYFLDNGELCYHRNHHDLW